MQRFYAFGGEEVEASSYVGGSSFEGDNHALRCVASVLAEALAARDNMSTLSLVAEMFLLFPKALLTFAAPFFITGVLLLLPTDLLMFDRPSLVTGAFLLPAAFLLPTAFLVFILASLVAGAFRVPVTAIVVIVVDPSRGPPTLISPCSTPR